MGMRGKREAGSREEAGLPQGTEKEELHVTGSPIGSRILRKTESVRWTVLLRKAKPVFGKTIRWIVLRYPAMNLVKSKDAPSSEGRNIGGIGESRKADTESGCSPIPSFPPGGNPEAEIPNRADRWWKRWVC